MASYPSHIYPLLLSVKELRGKEQTVLEHHITPDSYRILFALHGSFLTVYRERLARVEERDLFFFLPGEDYSIRTEDTPLWAIDIRFQFTEQANNGQGVLYSLPLPHDKTNTESVCDLFPDAPFSLRIGNTTESFLQGIWYEANKKALFFESMASLALNGLLLSITRDLLNVPFQHSNVSVKVMRYIDEHITENIRAGQVAEALGYHPNYINRVIKTDTGLSFRKYLLDAKLRYACYLLLSTDDSITDISIRLSFITTGRFGKLFAEKYRCSPSEYRKKRYQNDKWGHRI